jgi:hypothetical protein
VSVREVGLVSTRAVDLTSSATHKLTVLRPQTFLLHENGLLIPSLHSSCLKLVLDDVLDSSNVCLCDCMALQLLGLEHTVCKPRCVDSKEKGTFLGYT